MSDLICKKCKSIAVEYEDYCGGTSYFRCKTCGQRGNKDKFTQLTVFDHITQSVETLAEEIVYPYKIRFAYGSEDNWQEYWTSPLIENFYPTRTEAIAATVEELKKEYKKDE